MTNSDVRAAARKVAVDKMVAHFGPGKSSADPASWVIEAMLDFANPSPPAMDREVVARELLFAEIKAEGVLDAHNVRREAKWDKGAGHTRRLEDAAIRAISKAIALAGTGGGVPEGVKPKTFRATTPIDLIIKVFKHHGWPVTLGRMAAQFNTLYEMTADAPRNRYVATPRPTSPDESRSAEGEALENLLMRVGDRHWSTADDGSAYIPISKSDWAALIAAARGAK